jgi:predicted transcriptional regulator
MVSTSNDKRDPGAAEAIAAELNRERTTAADAVTALTDLIVGSITTKAPPARRSSYR